MSLSALKYIGHTLLLFSRPVICDTLLPNRLQHTGPPCPSPSPGVCPHSCSLHQWCHPAISSSDSLFSFCPESLPASEAFPMSHLFTSDEQTTGASALASVYPVIIPGWSPLRLTSLILLSKRLFRSFPQHHSLKPSILWHSAFFTVQLSQPYLTTGKTIVLTMWTFVGRIIYLLFNILSKFVIAFLPGNNRLDFIATGTIYSDFGAQEEEICHYFHIFPSIFYAKKWPEAMILAFIFFKGSLNPSLSLYSFSLIRRL